MEKSGVNREKANEQMNEGKAGRAAREAFPKSLSATVSISARDHFRGLKGRGVLRNTQRAWRKKREKSQRKGRGMAQCDKSCERKKGG